MKKNCDHEFVCDDKIKINYHYKDNHKQKTLVVFQGNGNAGALAKLYKNYVKSDKNENKKKETIQSIDKVLTRMNYYKSFDDCANVLLIRDDFLLNSEDKLLSPNNFWYFRALGRDIAPYLYQFLTEFKRKYKIDTNDLLIMGSSKGGFGALALANYDDLCGGLLSLFPIISNPLRYSYDRPNELKIFEEHYITESGLSIEEKKYVPVNYISNILKHPLTDKLKIVCGIGDDQTDILLNFSGIENVKMYLDCRIGGHLDYTETTVNITKKLLFGMSVPTDIIAMNTKRRK